MQCSCANPVVNGPSSNGRTPVFGTGGGGSNPPGPIRSSREGGAAIASPVLIAVLFVLVAVLGGPSAATAATSPGQVRGPTPGPPSQESPPAADSAAVHDRSRDAQRRFERLRVRHLPISLSSGSAPCDERIGRMCYWHGDSDDEPELEPESPRITAAREELLDTLAAAARRLPGDNWIAGVRVHYLVEAGRAHEALALVRSCAASEPGWCAALRGFALHRLERFEDSERAYREALESMDARTGEKWSSLELLLEGSDRSHLDRLGPENLETARRRIWLLADPYHLVRGNDRWTEHMSRHTGSRILGRAANPHGLPWTAGLDELSIRYGHETRWTRSVPTVGSSMRPLVTGHQPRHSERYMPPDGVLAASALSDGTVWGSPVERHRTAYAPSYAPELGVLQTVVARFRRDDSLLVVAPFRLERPDSVDLPASASSAGPPDSLSRRVQAGLFLLPWGETSESRPASRRTLAERGALSLTVPLGEYVYSVEALDRSAGHGARARGGVALGPHPDDIPDLSDLLIAAGASPSPRSLDEVMGHLLPSLELGRLQQLSVVWEAYGLASGAAEVSYRLIAERLDRSLLSRVGEFLRLSRPGNPLNLEWSEPGPGRPGAHFRSVELDLRNLEAGSYELRLHLQVRDWAPIIRRRRLEVVG